MELRTFALLAFAASAVSATYLPIREDGSIHHGMPKYGTVDPDAYLNVTQIIQRWGYPVENYEVTTTDGYILQIQRIPHGINGTAKKSNGKVAFLQHGLFSSSFDFVNNLPYQSLGYILADHGYDVWLGNVRGNTYGRRHVNKSANNAHFWEFTFDEFIEYDLPNMIDFVLAKTGKPSLHYVGHSQGTVVMFGLLSHKPEYQKKVRVFAALAPVANVTTITSPMRYIAPFSNDADWILEWLGIGELAPNNKFMKFLADTMCAHSVSRDVCEDFIFLVCGLDTRQLNTTRLPVYISHTPAGTSVRNVAHFGQEVEQARFQMYNFGAKGNQAKYGQPTPPEYDVRQIVETPIGLYSSTNDWLADPADVDILRTRLNAKVLARDYHIAEEQFTHLDFLIGMYAYELVYKDLVAFLDGY